VLLKLLRGAGPQGLGGMRVQRDFGCGRLWRPLLNLPRELLRDYAQAHGLRWIDDPSNLDTHLRRNFLRAEILPRLTQRWPDATVAIAHSAAGRVRRPTSSTITRNARWRSSREPIPRP
jgi:tRNA(Ile)-lysidine synthase